MGRGEPLGRGEVFCVPAVVLGTKGRASLVPQSRHLTPGSLGTTDSWQACACLSGWLFLGSWQLDEHSPMITESPDFFFFKGNQKSGFFLWNFLIFKHWQWFQIFSNYSENQIRLWAVWRTVSCQVWACSRGMCSGQAMEAEEGYPCHVAQVACCTGSRSPWGVQSCVCPHSPCSGDCRAVGFSPWSHYSHGLICHCALERHLVASLVWLWSLLKPFSLDTLTSARLYGCLSHPHLCSLQHSLLLSPSLQSPGAQRPFLNGIEQFPRKRHLWSYFPALNVGKEHSDAENVGKPVAAWVPLSPGCWGGGCMGVLSAQQDFAVGISLGLSGAGLILKGRWEGTSSLAKVLCVMWPRCLVSLSLRHCHGGWKLEMCSEGSEGCVQDPGAATDTEPGCVTPWLWRVPSRSIGTGSLPREDPVLHRILLAA